VEHDWRGDRSSRAATKASRVFIYALNVARQAGHTSAIEQELVGALEREISATFLEPEQQDRAKSELN
jgi:hypothetical protein